MGSIKSGAMTQQAMGSIKCGGAAAARYFQYKEQGRCRGEIRAVKKLMVLPVSIKSGGAAAKIDGQYKKRGHCRSEILSV